MDADGVTSITTYDDLGDVALTGIDVDRNGTLAENGSDRTRRSLRTFALRDGKVVTRTVQTGYLASGPVEISRREEAVNGTAAWRSNYGVEVATTITWNGATRTETSQSEDGSSVVNTSTNGRLVSSVYSDAASSYSTTYTYTTLGQVASETRDGVTTTTTYLAGSDLPATVTVSGANQPTQVSEYAYDDRDRRTVVTLPDDTTQTTEYWPTGETKRTHGSQTYDVSYTYDAAGRMKTLTTSGAAGPAVTTWNYGNDRLTSKVYDDGKGPSYTYTPAGRLSTRLWARGITTTYGYNTAGELKQVTYSDSTPGVTGMHYDGMGRLISVTDASGSRTIARSASGQLADESWSSGLFAGAAVSRSFDANERLSTLSVTGTNGSLIGDEVTYNYAGQRIVSVSTADGYTATQQWTGSRLGNTVHSQSGGATITMGRGYDGLNRLVTAGAVGTNSTSYQYNSLNQRTRATRSADGSYFDYGYDALGQVTSGARRWSDGTQVPGEQFGYGFDGIGNRTTATRNNRVSTYTPNKLNQYTQRTIPDKIDVTGKAEPAATITVDGQVATRSQAGWFWKDVTLNNAASPAFKNILIQSTGGTAPLTETAPGFLPQSPEAFTHDADGNLTQDGRYTYRWDGENRLIAVETRAAAIAAGTPGVRLVMEYDNQSRRVSTAASRWTGTAFSPIYKLLHHYDDWNQIAETLEQGTPIRSYIWSPDLSGNLRGAGGVGGLLRMADLTSEDGSAYAYTYDGNGNVNNLWALMDGTVAATYRYGAFGEMLEATGVVAEFNPVRFSTKYEMPESVGLLYYGYRYYNPETGRWLIRDPIEEEGGVNVYGFIENSSVNQWDMLGLEFTGTYTISSRKLVLTDNDRPKGWFRKGNETCECTGSSGTNEANDIDAVGEGPIPTGDYVVYYTTDSRITHSVVLDPDDDEPLNDQWDDRDDDIEKSNFRIHVEIESQPRNGSDGCIVTNENDYNSMIRFMSQTARGESVTIRQDPSQENPVDFDAVRLGTLTVN